MKYEKYLCVTLTYEEAMEKLAALVSSQTNEIIRLPIELDGDLKISNETLYIRVLNKEDNGKDYVIIGKDIKNVQTPEQLNPIKTSLEQILNSLNIKGEICSQILKYN